MNVPIEAVDIIGRLNVPIFWLKTSAKPQKSFCLFGLFSGFSGCRQA
jgi:hypothetical protein